MFYVYILLCRNNSYYTGYTTDIERRYNEHVNGSLKCKYTRSFPPIKLAACWQINGTAAEAMKIEHSIKRCTRQQKDKLINKHIKLAELLDISLSSLPIRIKS